MKVINIQCCQLGSFRMREILFLTFVKLGYLTKRTRTDCLTVFVFLRKRTNTVKVVFLQTIDTTNAGLFYELKWSVLKLEKRNFFFSKGDKFT